MKFMTMILALFISFSSFADKESKDEKRKGEFFKKELSLSDEQLTKMKELLKTPKEEMKVCKKEFFQLKKSFQEAMKDPNTSKEDLTAKFEAFNKSRDEYHRKKFALMLKMREVLTPAQMEKFHAVKEKFYKKFRKGKKDK